MSSFKQDFDHSFKVIKHLGERVDSFGCLATKDDLLNLVYMMDSPLFTQLVNLQEAVLQLRAISLEHELSAVKFDFDLKSGKLVVFPQSDEVEQLENKGIGGVDPASWKRLEAMAEGRVVEKVVFNMTNVSSLGFDVVGVHGPRPGDVGIYVQDVQPGSVAARSGGLRKNDQILAVNGSVFERSVSYERAAHILQLSSGPIELVVARAPDLGDSKPCETTPTGFADTILCSTESSKASEVFDMVLNTEWTQLEVVNLVNDGSGLGFGIIGGKSTGVVVKTILPGGVADRDGRLRSGDHLIQIGDINVRGMGSEQVASVLRQSGAHVRLIVARGIVEPPSVCPPYAPIIPTQQLTEHVSQLNAFISSYSGFTVNPDIESSANLLLTEEVLPAEVHPLPAKLATSPTTLGSEVEILDVELVKDVIGLGVSVVGYVSTNVTDESLSGIFVRSIAEGSGAALDRRIQVNDQIIAVDDQLLEGFTNQESVEILRNTGHVVRLKLARYKHGRKHDLLYQDLMDADDDKLVGLGNHRLANQSIYSVDFDNFSFEPLKNEEDIMTSKWKSIIGDSYDILVAHISKFKEGGGLGISLEGTVDVENGVEVHPHHYIRSVMDDGPVGLNGKLRSGDELLEVNGIQLYGLNHVEVVTILKELSQHVCLVCARRTSAIINPNDYLYAPVRDQFFQIPSPPPTDTVLSCGSSDVQIFTDRLVKAKSEQALVMGETIPDDAAYGSKLRSRSLEPLTGLAMWGNEVVQIELQKGERGLGFSILDYQDPINPEETVIVIRSLVPGGVAQLDGRLIPGDRLLFVNDVNLERATLDHAVMALKGAPKGVVVLGVAKPLPLPEIANNSSEDLTSLDSKHTLTSVSPPATFAQRNSFQDSSEIVSEILSMSTAARESKDTSRIGLEDSLSSSSTLSHERAASTLTLESDGSGTKTPSLSFGYASNHPKSSPPASVVASKGGTVSPELLLMRTTSPTGVKPPLLPKPKIGPIKMPSAAVRSVEEGSNTFAGANESVAVQSTVPSSSQFLCSLDVFGRPETVLPVSLERTIRVPKSGGPLGIVIESVGSGVNGCIVKSVAANEAVSNDGRIHVGDLIVGINNETMRRVTNAQARAILRRSALLATDVSITFIATSDIARHLNTPSCLDNKSKEKAAVSSKSVAMPSQRDANTNPARSPSPSHSVLHSTDATTSSTVDHVTPASASVVMTSDSSLNAKASPVPYASSAAGRVPFDSAAVLQRPDTLSPVTPQDLGNGESDKQPFNDTGQLVARYSHLDGEIHLVRVDRLPGSSGLGLCLAGNRDLYQMSVFVAGVLPNSAAAIDGRIHIGDQLLQVNNKVLYGYSHLHASEIISSVSESPINFILLRRPDLRQQMAAFATSCSRLPPVQYKDDSSTCILQWPPVQMTGDLTKGVETCLTNPELANVSSTAATLSPQESLSVQDALKSVHRVNDVDDDGSGKSCDVHHSDSGVSDDNAFAQDDFGNKEHCDELLSNVKGEDQEKEELEREEENERIVGTEEMHEEEVPSEQGELKENLDEQEIVDSGQEQDGEQRCEKQELETEVQEQNEEQEESNEEKQETEQNVSPTARNHHEKEDESLAENCTRDGDETLANPTKAAGNQRRRNRNADAQLDGSQAGEKKHSIENAVASRGDEDVKKIRENNETKEVKADRKPASRLTAESRSSPKQRNPTESVTSSSGGDDPTTCPILPGRETVIEINKGRMALGVDVIGGINTLLGVILIHEIYENGAAAKDGRLAIGDQILEVNGELFHDITDELANEILHQAPSTVRLVIYRDETPLREDEIYDIFNIDLLKKPGKGLGFSIIGREKNNGIFISDIIKGGTAELDGQLISGDQILVINGIDVRHVSQQHAAELLKPIIGRVSLTVGRVKCLSRSTSRSSSSVSDVDSDDEQAAELNSPQAKERIKKTKEKVAG